MSINGSQKAFSCVESEKKKIKYTCAGNGSFLLTHTWELSLLSWDCNLPLIFCNASFSSLSLSRSDLSFLKSSSYIWTCNHHEQYVNFSRAILWFGCFLSTTQAEGWIPRGFLLCTILQTKFPCFLFVTDTKWQTIAIIQWHTSAETVPSASFCNSKSWLANSSFKYLNKIANTSINLFKGLAVAEQTFYQHFSVFSSVLGTFNSLLYLRCKDFKKNLPMPV